MKGRINFFDFKVIEAKIYYYISGAVGKGGEWKELVKWLISLLLIGGYQHIWKGKRSLTLYIAISVEANVGMKLKPLLHIKVKIK